MKNMQRVLTLVRIGLMLRAFAAATSRRRKRPLTRRERIAAQVAVSQQRARKRLAAIELPDVSNLSMPDIRQLQHIQLPDVSHLTLPDVSHLTLPDLHHVTLPDASGLLKSDLGRSLGLAPKRNEGAEMKFVLGLATGIAIGAVGAVVYASRSGRDLRLSLDEVKAELARRDTDQVVGRLEARMATLQTQLEEQIAVVKAKAAEVVEQAGGAAKAHAEAEFEVPQGVEAAADAATEAVAEVVDAAAEKLDVATDTGA